MGQAGSDRPGGPASSRPVPHLFSGPRMSVAPGSHLHSPPSLMRSSVDILNSHPHDSPWKRASRAWIGQIYVCTRCTWHAANCASPPSQQGSPWPLAAEHAEGGGRGSGQRRASAQGAQRQGRALRGRGGGGRDGSLPDSSADGQFLFLPPLCKLSLRM